jgi:trehalose-6-phosphate synthase
LSRFSIRKRATPTQLASDPAYGRRFTRAAGELGGVHCEPHDIVALKDAIVRGLHLSPKGRRRMRSMRRRLQDHDVAHRAVTYLNALDHTPAEAS